MTTGRINQVTIVTPRVRRPTTLFRGKRSLVTGPAGVGARGACRSGGLGPPRSAPHPLPSSEFPRAPSASGRGAHDGAPRTLPKRPKRRPFGRVQREASPAVGCPRWLVVLGEASGQAPTKPSTQRVWGCSPAPCGVSPVPEAAGSTAAPSVGTPADRRAPRFSGSV